MELAVLGAGPATLARRADVDRREPDSGGAGRGGNRDGERVRRRARDAPGRQLRLRDRGPAGRRDNPGRLLGAPAQARRLTDRGRPGPLRVRPGPAPAPARRRPAGLQVGRRDERRLQGLVRTARRPRLPIRNLTARRPLGLRAPYRPSLFLRTSTRWATALLPSMSEASTSRRYSPSGCSPLFQPRARKKR